MVLSERPHTYAEMEKFFTKEADNEVLIRIAASVEDIAAYGDVYNLIDEIYADGSWFPSNLSRVRATGVTGGWQGDHGGRVRS